MLALGLGGIAQLQDARVDEQAAIAVFGEAGQAVDVGDLDAGRLQRLDQRIGQPLRQLVQRHEAGRRIVRSSSAGWRQQSPSGTPPSSSRDGQIGPELAQQLATGWRAPATRPPSAQRGQSDRTARPGAASSTRAKTSGARRQRWRRAGAADRRGRRGPAADWRRVTWKADASDSLGRLCSAAASARKGRRRSAENAPSANMARLASARPSERPTVVAGGSVAIAPARPGAGIEQDADDGEIEGRARALAGDRAMPSPGRSRPSGRGRRPRNAASAHGTARRASG